MNHQVLALRERQLVFARFPSVLPTFWRHFGHALAFKEAHPSASRILRTSRPDRTRSLPNQQLNLGHEQVTVQSITLARDVQFRARGHVGPVLALDDGCQSASGLHEADCTPDAQRRFGTVGAGGIASVRPRAFRDQSRQHVPEIVERLERNALASERSCSSRARRFSTTCLSAPANP